MEKKWIALALVLIVGIGLAFWLKPREYNCQRCGAHIDKGGPFIIGVAAHYMSGAGGNKGLYCKRHGHVLVKKYDPDKKVTDWMYQRDSYKSEEEYQEDTYFRDHKEEMLYNSQAHLRELSD